MKRFGIKIGLIIIVVLLFISLVFLPNIIDMIPSLIVKNVICLLLNGIVFFLIILDTFNTIKKKKYRTTIFIVLSNLLMVFSLFVFAYLSLVNVNVKDIEKIHYINNLQIKGEIFFFAGLLLNKFFKNQD